MEFPFRFTSFVFGSEITKGHPTKGFTEWMCSEARFEAWLCEDVSCEIVCFHTALSEKCVVLRTSS